MTSCVLDGARVSRKAFLNGLRHRACADGRDVMEQAPHSIVRGESPAGAFACHLAIARPSFTPTDLRVSTFRKVSASQCTQDVR